MLSRNLVRQDYSAHELYRAISNAVVRALTPANLAVFAVLTISYFVTGKIGQQLGIPNPSATAFWPPAGIAVAGLLLKGNRAWPGIFVGAFLVNVTASGPLHISLSIALINTLEAVLVAYLVKRFAGGVNAFYRAGDVLRFVFVAVTIPTMLCATIGVELLCMGHIVNWSEYWVIWSVWWFGDFLGALLLTPFLVLLLGHEHHSLGFTELVEATLLLTGLSVVCVYNFAPSMISWIPQTGLLYLCAPFMVWVALRFCPLEASGATLLVSGFALWGSLHGFGPFGNTTTAPLFAASYVAVITTTTMVLAAAMVQQKKRVEETLAIFSLSKARSEEEIRGLQDSLESLRAAYRNSRQRPANEAGPGLAEEAAQFCVSDVVGKKNCIEQFGNDERG